MSCFVQGTVQFVQRLGSAFVRISPTADYRVRRGDKEHCVLVGSEPVPKCHLFGLDQNFDLPPELADTFRHAAFAATKVEIEVEVKGRKPNIVAIALQVPVTSR